MPCPDEARYIALELSAALFVAEQAVRERTDVEPARVAGCTASRVLRYRVRDGSGARDDDVPCADRLVDLEPERFGVKTMVR